MQFFFFMAQMNFPHLLGSNWIFFSHTIHVWYIYLHEWLIFMVNDGKYTSPMDPMGFGTFISLPTKTSIYILMLDHTTSHFIGSGHRPGGTLQEDEAGSKNKLSLNLLFRFIYPYSCIIVVMYLIYGWFVGLFYNVLQLDYEVYSQLRNTCAQRCDSCFKGLGWTLDAFIAVLARKSLARKSFKLEWKSQSLAQIVAQVFLSRWIRLLLYDIVFSFVTCHRMPYPTLLLSHLFNLKTNKTCI